MNTDRLRDILALLRWSQRTLAGVLGIGDRQVRYWASGRYPVPAPVAAWLEKLALVAAQVPYAQGPSEFLAAMQEAADVLMGDRAPGRVWPGEEYDQ